MGESLVSSCCDCSDQEVDETEKQVARCKPEGLDALCRTTKFSRKELQIMYRGFKNVSNVAVDLLRDMWTLYWCSDL